MYHSSFPPGVLCIGAPSAGRLRHNVVPPPKKTLFQRIQRIPMQRFEWQKVTRHFFVRFPREASNTGSNVSINNITRFVFGKYRRLGVIKKITEVSLLKLRIHYGWLLVSRKIAVGWTRPSRLLSTPCVLLHFLVCMWCALKNSHSLCYSKLRNNMNASLYFYSPDAEFIVLTALWREHSEKHSQMFCCSINLLNDEDKQPKMSGSLFFFFRHESIHRRLSVTYGDCSLFLSPDSSKTRQR